MNDPPPLPGLICYCKWHGRPRVKQAKLKPKRCIRLASHETGLLALRHGGVGKFKARFNNRTPQITEKKSVTT